MGVSIKNFEPSKTRWIKPFQWYIATSSITATPGKVMLVEFEITKPQTVDGISIFNHTVVSGNVLVGLYGPITTEEVAQGSNLIATSNSTALNGTSAGQFIPFTSNINLSIGRYYAAVQYDDITHTYGRFNNTVTIPGWSQYYDRVGGFGAFTNPCPATTPQATPTPQITIRGLIN